MAGKKKIPFKESLDKLKEIVDGIIGMESELILESESRGKLLYKTRNGFPILEASVLVDPITKDRWCLGGYTAPAISWEEIIRKVSRIMEGE